MPRLREPDASFNRDRSGARGAERLLRHVRARDRLRPTARLETMARAGNRGAERALKLAEDPTSFLSTVQIGITLIGIFAGAYSGATLSEPLAAGCAALPAVASIAGGARLRARGDRHHLRLAHHRRARAQAPRAAQRRGHRRLRLRPDDGARRRRQPGRLVPARLDRGGARPPPPARRGAERRDRGGGEGDDRRGHRRRRLPRGRARAPRRRHPLRRPPAALDHGAAPRDGLDRRRTTRWRRPRRDARLRPLALPALRRLDRRGDRLHPRQGHPRDAAHRRRPTCARWRASRSTSARASRRSG